MTDCLGIGVERGTEKKWEVTTNGQGVSSEGDENVVKWIVMTVAEFYEYAENTGLSTLKGQSVWYINYILIKLLF